MNRKTADSSKRNLAKTIKFTSEELQEIEKLAADKNLSFCTYVRESALSGNMPDDYYEKKYMCKIIPITEGINRMKNILDSPFPNIEELRTIVNSLDRETIKLWRY